MVCLKYNPHDYQKYATNFIIQNPISAILLEMGLGKSVITLTAINDLLFDSFEVQKILVVAPLRVAVTTWPAEIEKWEHLDNLTYSVAVGTEQERKTAIMKEADIYIINRENVHWLVEESGFPFDYDMVVIDELSSFKSYQAKRFRIKDALRYGELYRKMTIECGLTPNARLRLAAKETNVSEPQDELYQFLKATNGT